MPFLLPHKVSSLLVVPLLIALQLGPIFAWHRYPQTVFYNEFLSAAICVVLGAVLAWQGRVALRVSLLVPLAIAIGVLGGSWLGAMPNTNASAVQSLIDNALFVLLGIFLIQQAVACLGTARVVDLSAWGMLICACLQCAASAFQLNGISESGWVMAKLMNAAYGNIAQENHFADLLWLGLVSVLHLWLRRRFPTIVALIVAALISFFSALSVSRAVWLYTAVVPLVAVIYTRRLEPAGRRRVWLGMGAVLVLSVVSQMWLAFGGAQSALGVTSAIDRVSEGGSNGQRMFDWVIAWKTALAHPLTGVGPGMYSWQTALGSIGLPPVNYVRIGENAHNTLLHFAAEFGLVFILVALVLIGMWLWRRWRETPTLETLWGLGIIAVIGAHSMVEYPLWYTYFLVPFACAIGVVDAGDEGLPTLRFNARWLLIPVAIGVVILASTWRDYRRLESAYKTLNDTSVMDATTSEQLDAIGASISKASLLAPQAAILRLRAWRNTDLQRLPEIVKVCDESLKIKPQYNSFTACMTAYTLSGRKADADQINEIVCGAFAPMHSRPFIQYAQKLYATRKWQLPAKGRCL
ncbi:MAG: lipid core-O-antigen ligase-like enyme [Rhodocyclales bacterium]|nr:lipid core-O-antigen ligase-like enyme [Rhodocyclales bacterium]